MREEPSGPAGCASGGVGDGVSCYRRAGDGWRVGWSLPWIVGGLLGGVVDLWEFCLSRVWIEGMGLSAGAMASSIG